MLAVGREAFGEEKGPEIESLVSELLIDPTARPLLSLLAVDGGRPVGHVLFTKARIADNDRSRSASILAPLAVRPDDQGRGVGRQLVNEGMKMMAESGGDLLFVLGHPEYYPRFGFKPAGALGFDAPYPIPEEHADAWMVCELRAGSLGSVRGKVMVADVLNRPEHWRE